MEIATSGQFSTFAMFLFQPFDFSSSELPRLCELTLSWGFRAAAGIKDGEIKSKNQRLSPLALPLSPLLSVGAASQSSSFTHKRKLDNEVFSLFKNVKEKIAEPDQNEKR